MRDYFKPMRRKVGIATLVLACLFTAGWVRSLRTTDVFQRRMTDNTVYFLVSNRSRLYWQDVREVFPAQLSSPEPLAGGITLPSVRLKRFHFERTADETNYFRVLTTESFSCLLDGSRIYPGLTLKAWMAPYWSIVLPLVVVSAWLLLSKFRSSKPSPIVQH